MYLPAFPEMAGDLGASASGIQLTLTACLVGLGFGQLFIGPLSDAVGRRRPLLIGSAVCLVASVVCALAPNVEVLAVGRFVQGLSGAAGVVLARAIISDTARGAVAAKLLGVLMIINVIAPVVAPLSGGAIIATLGWRAVFWVLAGLTLLMLLGTMLWAKESLPPSKRIRGGFKATLVGVRKTLGNRNYVGYLLTFCFTFAALFAYIAASPFVMQNVMGLSAVHPRRCGVAARGPAGGGNRRANGGGHGRRDRSRGALLRRPDSEEADFVGQWRRRRGRDGHHGLSSAVSVRSRKRPIDRGDRDRLFDETRGARRRLPETVVSRAPRVTDGELRIARGWVGGARAEAWRCSRGSVANFSTGRVGPSQDVGKRALRLDIGGMPA